MSNLRKLSQQGNKLLTENMGLGLQEPLGAFQEVSSHPTPNVEAEQSTGAPTPVPAPIPAKASITVILSDDGHVHLRDVSGPIVSIVGALYMAATALSSLRE